MQGEVVGMKGNIHSIQTFGTVDGPGIRTVVFFQGCQLRCLYCHNRDTWDASQGSKWEAADLAKFVSGYRNYFKASGGGVTASGGEPCLQPGFLGEFFKLCRQAGIHTALDTSGFVDEQSAGLCLDHTDLVLLDIKHLDDAKCRELTGQGNSRALRFLEALQDRGIPVVLRQVVVPGWTDSDEYVMNLRDFAQAYENVNGIELLPFHKAGEHKWEKSPTAELPEMAGDRLAQLKVVCGQADIY